VTGKGTLPLRARHGGTIRRHLLRSLLRVTVLVGSDLLAFLLLRAAVRAARNGWLLGRAASGPVTDLLPQGYLGGWEFAAALVLGLLVSGSYGQGDRRRDGGRLLAGVALAVALSTWETVWQVGLPAVALRYVITVAAVWPLLVVERWLVDRAVLRVRPTRTFAQRVLFVGDRGDPAVEALSEKLLADGGMVSVGWLSPRSGPASSDYVGGVGDAAGALESHAVETIILCTDLPAEDFDNVAAAGVAAGCRILSVSRYHGVSQGRPGFVWLRGVAFLDLTAPSLRAQQLFAKRALDLLGAAGGLLLLAPFFALTAVLIRLDSAGPVFFRQDRIGRGGKPFRVWKFRTMQHGASDAPHREFVMKLLSGTEEPVPQESPESGVQVFKLREDARVTRVGRVLRRLSFDEFPQLINVLRGEMSLVGPRPPLPYEVDAYEHWQFDRLGVMPGMTGLWQVSGRNRLTYRQMCELDVAYVERWSLWLDFKILLKTVPVVLLNSGKAG